MSDKLKSYFISKFRTVDDLPSLGSRASNLPLQQDRRKLVNIAVIDDQPFEAGVNLRNYGYEITEIGDVKNILEVRDYPIVLCDLMDVGLHFDKTNQGASIIGEIRKNYPSILIAAYTGSAVSGEPARRARQLSDGFIKKDAEIETWVAELDQLITIATDPKAIWYRTRSALINEELNSRVVLELEDAYVKSILEKDSDFGHLKSVISKRSIKNSASNIIHGLAASTIFRVIVGG